MANPTGSSSRAAAAAERLDGWLGLSHARWVQVIESIAALILSLAALATSWSGYQAGRWAGLMATDFSQASALRVESAQATDLASRQTQIDLQLFSGWLDAIAVGNQVLADFSRARFRPEFAPAFEAWLASEPLTNPQALKSSSSIPSTSLPPRLRLHDSRTRRRRGSRPVPSRTRGATTTSSTRSSWPSSSPASPTASAGSSFAPASWRSGWCCSPSGC